MPAPGTILDCTMLSTPCFAETKAAWTSLALVFAFLVPPVARNLMCKAPMPSSYSAEAQPSSTLKLMLSRQEWAGADPVEAVLPLLAASRDVLRCKHRSLSASSWVLVLPFTLRNREPFLWHFHQIAPSTKAWTYGDDSSRSAFTSTNRCRVKAGLAGICLGD